MRPPRGLRRRAGPARLPLQHLYDLSGKRRPEHDRGWHLTARRPGVLVPHESERWDVEQYGDATDQRLRRQSVGAELPALADVQRAGGRSARPPDWEEVRDVQDEEGLWSRVLRARDRGSAEDRPGGTARRSFRAFPQ